MGEKIYPRTAFAHALRCKTFRPFLRRQNLVNPLQPRAVGHIVWTSRIPDFPAVFCWGNMQISQSLVDEINVGYIMVDSAFGTCSCSYHSDWRNSTIIMSINLCMISAISNIWIDIYNRCIYYGCTISVNKSVFFAIILAQQGLLLILMEPVGAR